MTEPPRDGQLTARAYLDTAEAVLDESSPREFLNVAVGNAVLAAITASDAICCVRLGRRHRGEDHRAAAELLSQAVPDGPQLAGQLLRLLGLKDTGHYGTSLIDMRTARDGVKRAARLVTRAREELER